MMWRLGMQMRKWVGMWRARVWMVMGLKVGVQYVGRLWLVTGSALYHLTSLTARLLQLYILTLLVITIHTFTHLDLYIPNLIALIH